MWHSQCPCTCKLARQLAVRCVCKRSNSLSSFTNHICSCLKMASLPSYPVHRGWKKSTAAAGGVTVTPHQKRAQGRRQGLPPALPSHADSVQRASKYESTPPHCNKLTRPIAGIKQRRNVWSGQRANIIRVHEVAVQVGTNQCYLARLVVALHLQAAGGQASGEHACRQGSGSAAAGRGSKPP